MTRRVLDNPFDDRFSDYLTDSSLLQGRADEIVLCHSSDDVINILKECCTKGIEMTIQGAMTGICGGGVPEGGCVINLSEMDGITGMSHNESTGEFTIRVESGVLLKDLNDLLKSKTLDVHAWDARDKKVYEKFLKSSDLFFPPDPTESLASIGGMAACDASGACSFKYGSMRKYIEGIKLVTQEKGEIRIRRGQYRYKDINELFNSRINPLPKWHSHSDTLKDVAGLYCKDEMDLIDLFIGSEGLLGVITELELKLLHAPKIKMGLMLFLDHTQNLIDFVEWLRNENDPAAIEYFDKNTLDLLRSFRDLKREVGDLPEIDRECRGGIYLEFHLFDEEQVEPILEKLFDQIGRFGVNQEKQWLALEASDFEKLIRFRHAAPECVNIVIAERKRAAPEINKIGTDMAVPDIHLKNILDMYCDDIKKMNLKSIIFGHIGNNHLHVNIIPEDRNSYNTSLQIVKNWADKVVEWGGTVTAEHGIGRLKKDLLKQMMSEADLVSMRAVREIIETSGLVNNSILLDSETKGEFDGV